MSWSKRIISFFHSDSPLTSRRVQVILAHPQDAQKLAQAIRANRHNQSQPFTLSKETREVIGE